jgi:hypothetical protein
MSQVVRMTKIKNFQLHQQLHENNMLIHIIREEIYLKTYTDK